jgi:hypothetical protein
MLAVLHSLGMFIVDLFKSGRRLEAENLFLRHQLDVALRHAPPRLRLIVCTVIDLADGGIGLWVGSTFGIPDQFELAIEGELTRPACKVAWRDCRVQ